MAKVSEQHVRYLSQLARIRVSGKELAGFTKEVASILKFVEQLQTADTEGLEPTSQVAGLRDVWRKDEVKPCDISAQELFKNARPTKDGYLKVPRVIE